MPLEQHHRATLAGQPGSARHANDAATDDGDVKVAQRIAPALPSALQQRATE